MERDGGLPLTRGQLDIWLAQEAALAGADWQLGLLGRIAGRVDRDHLHDAIRLVVQEAEPGRVAFFVTAGQVLQRAIDYPDVELDFYDLTGSEDTAREVGEIASSIRRKPMPLAGPLFKFALFQTSPDEFYLFACCHHIAMDGLGMVLVSRRIAAIIPPSLPVNQSRLLTSDHSTTWSKGSRPTKRRRTISKIGTTGARTFLPRQLSALLAFGFARGMTVPPVRADPAGSHRRRAG